MPSQVIRAGSGWEKPQHRCEVRVHIVGSYEGAVFQDTRADSEEYVAHKLGGGTINRGIEACIKMMLRGERSSFRVIAEHAFGDTGFLPIVPPNVDVDYDIELGSFTRVEDLSESKDGSLIKRIYEEGQGWEKPGEGWRVTMIIQGTN